MPKRCLVLLSCLGIFAPAGLWASDPAPPQIIGFAVTNAQKKIQWEPYPAAQQYNLLSTPTVVDGFTNDLSGIISGYTWTGTNANPYWFYRLQVTPLTSNALLAANVLNRLAYGPTPDELERVASIGPQAYIDEQLDFGTVQETIDDRIAVATNGVPTEPTVKTNWVNVTVAGIRSSPTLYMYLTATGDAYVDDVALYAGTGTNVNLLTNYVQNGDFESAFPGPWTVSANHAGSAISTNVKCSGNASLQVVASTPGSTQGSSIWQTTAAGLTNTEPCTLSFWYLPRTNSSILTIRLSQSGVVGSPTNEPSVRTLWVYATATGTATSTKLYIYLDGTGDAYIDDIKLVAGSVPETGANVLQNGNFESAFPAPYWTVATNATNSHISSTVSHSGNHSLYLAFDPGGSTDGSAIVQTGIPLTVNAVYTLSYWYIPSASPRLTVRLSGSGIRSEPDSATAAVYQRLTTMTEGSSLEDLRAWFCTHAVGAKRQLLEVLTQFLENHFVTQHSKTDEYFANNGYVDFNTRHRLATNLEFREISKWRAKLADPACTFYDLLRISAESPAMIIYLDTVGSRGDGSNIANENYARELLELFTQGVDNGYDQNDIVTVSKAWTGWRIRLVESSQESNPFAPQSTILKAGVTDNFTAVSNLVGLWSFNYREDRHNNSAKTIFPGKFVPARFGTPYTTKTYGNATPGLYELSLPARVGTSSIQDGYDVINHLANLPFTQEYISIKLCRLFVHDEFPNPTTDSNLPEYAFYDYTNPALSPEAALVRECMVAWENSSPRGNIRAVLNTIFNSDLFRSHGGSMQKVKTPLELAASTIRALRSDNGNGTFTASTDGYAFTAPLSRIGTMGLFDRDAPDGFPEAGPPWISTGTLAERLRFIQSALIFTGQTGKSDGGANNVTDPVALVKKKLPSGSWSNAGAVADYFLAILYPGEGKANLDLYRSAAIKFLNTLDNGTTTSNFSSLSMSGSPSPYDTRLRGMVGMLMTFQRFQEQ